MIYSKTQWIDVWNKLVGSEMFEIEISKNPKAGSNKSSNRTTAVDKKSKTK